MLTSNNISLVQTMCECQPKRQEILAVALTIAAKSFRGKDLKIFSGPFFAWRKNARFEYCSLGMQGGRRSPRGQVFEISQLLSGMGEPGPQSRLPGW